MSANRRTTLVASIGYQERSVGELIDALHEFDIEKVIDIRELPLSRRKGFSKTTLGKHLAQAGITYRHLREAGNPYRKLKASIERCLDLYGKHLTTNPGVVDTLASELRGQRVAILCYERQHEDCHRSVLIEALEDSGRRFKLVEVD